MRRILITCFSVGLNLVVSTQAHAWSHRSYDQIISAAQRYDEKLAASMELSDSVNFDSVKNLPFQINGILKVYAKYGRTIPSEIKRILRDPHYYQTKIELKKGRFGRVMINNLPYSYETLLTHAIIEDNPEIKLALLSFVTFIVAQAYQPITKVIFFNGSNFSRGDQSGKLFCIQAKRNTMPRCGRNLYQYWTTLMDNQVVNVKGVHPTSNIVKIIENSANQALYAYDTRQYQSLSINYQNNAKRILSVQANNAASHIISIWRQVITEK